ncbi:cell adhesion molecule CEACAM20 [Sarcophilus harrisii]
MKLSMKNQTLTILSVKRENIGSYQCEIQNPISSNTSDPFILTVNYGPDNIMFVPNAKKREIEVKFNDPLMLQCHVESYPPAQYLWQVNDTKIPDFSNSTYVIKNATWEDSGKYTCLAKNKVTNLSVSKSITVKVDAQSTGGSSSLLSGRVITGFVIGVLAVIMLIGTLIYIHFRKTGRISRHKHSENPNFQRTIQHTDMVSLRASTTREVIPQESIN